MRRLAGIVVLLLLALVLSSAAAFAHAELVAAQPAAGARIEHSPQTVTLTFDDPVETALGALRVLDAAGESHTVGVVVHPAENSARVAVRVADLPPGRYVVAWHLVGDDSHFVDGAYAFGVGAPAGPPPPPVPADGTGATLLLPIIHFGILAGALLGIGLPLGAVTIGRRAARPPNFVEAGAWIVLACAALCDLALRADLAGGTLASAATTRFGELRLLTITAALIAFLAVARRRRAWILLIAADILTALSLSLAGHAATSEPAALGVAADTLHLLAAAAWIGLLAVGTTLEPSAELAAISPLAMTAVGVIVVSGALQTLRNVGSFLDLFTTAYGREIDLKIALMFVAFGAALAARRALARRRFAIGRWLKLELWLLTAVIAVTAVLVESPLPRDAGLKAFGNPPVTRIHGRS